MKADPSRMPPLSVVLITADHYDSIRKVVEHLRSQSGRERIELVIMAPRKSEVRPDHEALEGFFDWHVEEVGLIEELGHVQAEGVRRSRGDVVVYVEEHSFPQPGWAEALICAHEGDWAAVGPSMTNANPRTRASWVSFLLDFGDWAGRKEAGRMTILPSHQTSYKRERLLTYGSRLAGLIETETMLQKDLVENGCELYFEPAAVTSHVNVSRLPDLVRVEFHNYRAFAASRVAQGNWSLGRRLVYIAGSPLIPLVRGYRLLGAIRRSGLSLRRSIKILPTSVIALATAALGESLGYAFGIGNSSSRRLSFELRRRLHVTAADRRELFES